MLQLVTPAVNMPVTLQEAKAACRVTHADDDATIRSYVRAATSYCEGSTGYLGRALISQTWRITQSGFDTVRLDMPTVQSISSVTYFDSDEVEQTLDPAEYSLRSDGMYADFVLTGTSPGVYARDDAVRINFVSGYGDNPADVPFSIRQAIMLMVSDWFDGQETVAPWVDKLLYPFRIHPL